MNRILILLLVLLSSFGNSNSQEVLCNIRVVPKGDLPISDRQKLQTLQKSAKEFINNRKWTNEIFKDEERIEFNLSFNILEKVSTDRYSGTIQVQYSRPVFKSSYYSPVLNYLDKEIEFDFIDTQPIEFNENTHTSNLSSILSFYTYIIIGLDYSTFSDNGGNIYFQKAKKLLKMHSLLLKMDGKHLKVIKIDFGYLRKCLIQNILLFNLYYIVIIEKD